MVERASNQSGSVKSYMTGEIERGCKQLACSNLESRRISLRGLAAVVKRFSHCSNLALRLRYVKYRVCRDEVFLLLGIHSLKRRVPLRGAAPYGFDMVHQRLQIIHTCVS